VFSVIFLVMAISGEGEWRIVRMRRETLDGLSTGSNDRKTVRGRAPLI